MNPSNSASSIQHESLYIQMVPLFLAVMLMLGMVIGGATMSANNEDARKLAAWLIIGGTVIGVAGVLSLLFCISRRRWRFTEQGLEVRQGLAILPRSLARETHVPLTEIAGLTQIFTGAPETIELTTRSGKAFRLFAASNAPVIVELMAAASQVQGKAVPMREGLSFWASRTVMWLIALAFVFNVIIAGVSLMAVFDGSMSLSSGAGGSAKGMGIVLALPFFLFYAWWQIFKRRQRVLGQRTE